MGKTTWNSHSFHRRINLAKSSTFFGSSISRACAAVPIFPRTAAVFFHSGHLNQLPGEVSTFHRVGREAQQVGTNVAMLLVWDMIHGQDSISKG